MTRFRHPKAEVGCKSIVHLYPRGKACSIVNSLRAQWVLELPLTSKRIRRQRSVYLLQGVNKHRLQNICKCIERTFPLAKGSAWWEFSPELIPGHVQELQVGMCFSKSIPRSSDKVGIEAHTFQVGFKSRIQYLLSRVLSSHSQKSLTEVVNLQS